MHLRKLVLSALVLTTFALNGCGGGGGGGGSSSLNPNLGSVAGNVYVTGANALIVSQSTTPPAGDHAAAGATVTIGSVNTKTDSHGAFQLNGVTAGEGNVTISLAAANAVVPVDVFPGSVVQLGPPPVTRQTAYATAQAALNGVATLDANTYTVLGPQEPLPVGTVVSPALGDDNGLPSAANNYTVKTPQWLFYADPVSYLRDQHVVYFYFVDATTGTLTTMPETSWPVINGVTYYGSRDTNVTSPDLLHKQAIAKALASPHVGGPSSVTTVRPHAGPTTYALLIEGADESDEDADLSHIKTMFGHGGIPPASVYQALPGGAPPLGGFGRSPRMDQVNSYYQTICQKAQPEDTFFLYITGHGLKSGGVQLDSQGVTKDGTPVTFESLYASAFDFSKLMACKVIIIIDACYSGKMQAAFAAALTKNGCKNWTVMSSTDATHESVGIPLLDPRGSTGGMFTTAFVDAFSAQVSANPTGTADLGKAFDDANTSISGSFFYPDARVQNPQYATGKAGASCPCNTTASLITPQDTWCNSNDDTIYVADAGSDNVGVIPGTYTSTGYTFSVSTVVSVGNAPHALTGDPSSNQLFVANSDGTLSIVDATNNTMTKTLSIGHGVGGLLADNQATGQVFVCNSTDGTVSIVDSISDTVTGTVNVGTMPIGIQADPGLNQIFVATSGGIVVIDGTTDKVVNTISLPGTSPAGLDINVNTHMIYVVDKVGGVNTVSVINGSTGKVVAPSTINAGTQPYYIAVNSVSGNVFVDDSAGNTVSIMNGTNNTLIKTLPTGHGPAGLGLFGTLNVIYVPNASDNSMTLIDGQTNTVTSTLQFP